MEAVLNFRKKLNNCIVLLQNIALLKGEEAQKSESAKNNNIFFTAFSEYTKLIRSYAIIKKFEGYTFSAQDLIDIKEITKQVREIFDTKQVYSPIQLQNSIKKLNEKLQLSWQLFSDNLTREILDQLEIFWLVCNNRKEIRDIINAIKAIKEWPVLDINYNKYCENLSKAHEQIQEIHFDDEIENFLRKIKDKTATLLDLDDKILTWIRENNLNGNIVLGIKI